MPPSSDRWPQAVSETACSVSTEPGLYVSYAG
jgi:hypothetical protein